jgi:hypothetical protein
MLEERYAPVDRAFTGSDAGERRATAAIRSLVARGLSKDSPPSDYERAIATLEHLSGPIEIHAAIEVLGEHGAGPDRIKSEPAVRRALFRSLAAEPTVGQARLVEFAVTAQDPVRKQAADALPITLSGPARSELMRWLRSGRELYTNRAASIAGAHPAAELIPSLVSAQYAPPRVKRGDEAWIAIGQSVHYVQGQIPVVGAGSAAYQPVIGTIYEGSLFRVMESVVEIYRTEVHFNLGRVAEELTGQPPPPFGYDEDRWMEWYRHDFPRLAAERRLELERQREESNSRSTPSNRDS